MTPLEQQRILKAIQDLKLKAVGDFSGQALTGIGNMADDANIRMGATDLLNDIIKRVPVGKGQELLTKAASSGVGRFAGRALPVLGALQAVGDVGDIVLGDDSLGNKAMDAAGMGIGGTIGGVLGMGNPLLIAGGATVGKSASDGLQFLFGGGKSSEERKLEEAVKLLQQRGLV